MLLLVNPTGWATLLANPNPNPHPHPNQVKMVTLVNPGNPTGVMIPRATIEAFSELC